MAAKESSRAGQRNVDRARLCGAVIGPFTVGGRIIESAIAITRLSPARRATSPT